VNRNHRWDQREQIETAGTTPKMACLAAVELCDDTDRSDG
jgi:hypothetical protein